MEKRYELFRQVLPEIFYSIAIIDDPLSGKVPFVSDQIFNILGYSSHEFIADSHLYGKFVWNGASTFLGLVRDITEQAEAKKKIEVRDEFFELTGTIAKIGGWELDPHTLEGSWSDEVARIHDLDPGTPIDVTKGLDYYTPESRPLIEHAVTTLIRERTPYDLELEIITAKNRRKDIRTAGQPAYEDGKLVKVRGIIQDIAEITADIRFKHIPVVVLTTSSAEEDVIRAYGLHANCYVVKPVEFDSFVKAV